MCPSYKHVSQSGFKSVGMVEVFLCDYLCVCVLCVYVGVFVSSCVCLSLNL